MASGQAGAVRESHWSYWLDRAVWLALAMFFLYRCILPLESGPLSADLQSLRIATANEAVLVVFDGSR